MLFLLFIKKKKTKENKKITKQKKELCNTSTVVFP